MTKQTILLIIVIAAIAVSGYVWVRYSQTRQTMAADPGRTETDETTERLLSEVKRLREIRLDTSLFQDRLFQALQEPPTPPEAAVTPGRTNPFIPF